jgi:prophage regulatory protein
MKKYIRPLEIAENLGVDVATIWRWVKAGILPKPFRPTQRTTVFDAEQVQAALDKMQAEQAGEA